jgi:hypothetical protein
MVLRTLVVVAACIALVSHRSSAQGGNAPVTVRGLVYDSQRHAPLANAAVTVIDQRRSSMSDARGLFQFDSIAPGPHTFGVQHPALDSIGFNGLSLQAAIDAGRDQIMLAIPSFATLWRAACGESPAPADSGFIYGTVRDAITGAAVPNATIELTWVDLSIGQQFRVSQTRWRGQTRADSSGSYDVCGVPTAVSLRIRATTDSSATGLIDLLARGARVQRRDLVVGRVTSADSVPRGTIAGLVTDTAGKPFPDARIVVDDVPEIRSGANGRFTMSRVPAGSRQVEVLALGRLPVLAVLDVLPNDTVTFAAQLRPVTLLDAVRVRASAQARRFVEGYAERRRSGFGYAVDSSVISTRGNLTSVFSEMPNMWVERSPAGAGQFVLTLPATRGGRCPATLWIDGVYKRDFEELNALHTNEIAAVEVYPQAFSVPARFLPPRQDGLCGAVIVWTKWAFGG